MSGVSSTSIQITTCIVLFKEVGKFQGTHNAARKLIDNVHYMSDAIASMSSKPAKYVSSWVTDRIAPDYWVPNWKLKVTSGK